MKTIEIALNETAMLNYSKRDSHYAKQSMVMTIFWKLQRSYKFANKQIDFTISEIWDAVKKWYSSLSFEANKATKQSQGDLSNEYRNKPTNYYYGD